MPPLLVLAGALLCCRLDRSGCGYDGRSERTGNGCGQPTQDLNLYVAGLSIMIDGQGTGFEERALGNRAELGKPSQSLVQSPETTFFLCGKLGAGFTVESSQAFFKSRFWIRSVLSVMGEGAENDRAFRQAAPNGGSSVKWSPDRVLAAEIMIDHLAQAPLQQVDFVICPDQGLRNILKGGELLGRKQGKGAGSFLDENEFLLRGQVKYHASDLFRFLGCARFSLFRNDGKLFLYNVRVRQIEKEGKNHAPGAEWFTGHFEQEGWHVG